MDTNSIRRENLRALAATYKSQADFAAACGTAASVISLIISPNPKRNLGHRLARKIEEAQGLPLGWLDSEHSTSEANSPESEPIRSYKSPSTQSFAPQPHALPHKGEGRSPGEQPFAKEIARGEGKNRRHGAQDRHRTSSRRRARRRSGWRCAGRLRWPDGRSGAGSASSRHGGRPRGVRRDVPAGAGDIPRPRRRHRRPLRRLLLLPAVDDRRGPPR